MQNTWRLVLDSFLLGIGLAMDAFSVSVVNGMNEPTMKRKRIAAIAGVFGGFQFLMPLTGWFLVTTLLSVFEAFRSYIPWAAMIILVMIGGRMIFESMNLRKTAPEKEERITGLWSLVLQGIATSIDALSAGFAMSSLNLLQAAGEALVIGCVTFVICTAGLGLGKKAGKMVTRRATLLGGLILIFLGVRMIVA